VETSTRNCPQYLLTAIWSVYFCGMSIWVIVSTAFDVPLLPLVVFSAWLIPCGEQCSSDNHWRRVRPRGSDLVVILSIRDERALRGYSLKTPLPTTSFLGLVWGPWSAVHWGKHDAAICMGRQTVGQNKIASINSGIMVVGSVCIEGVATPIGSMFYEIHGMN
jgi:hypothetical protein